MKDFKESLLMILYPLLLFILLISLVGCGTYNTQPKIQVTHVLAVTEQGDTLRLPISMIKPNVYYNVVSYPNRYYGGWYNNHYQPSHYNYRPIYTPSKGSGSGSSGNNNNNNNNNKIVPRENPDKRPSGEVLLKGKK